MLSIDSIRKDFPHFQIHNTNDDLWKKGINCMPHKEFNSIAKNFLLWCKVIRRKRSLSFPMMEQLQHIVKS